MILRPQPGYHLPNSPWPEIIKKNFPARESLVSEVPAGDGKIYTVFFTVYTPEWEAKECCAKTETNSLLLLTLIL